MRSFFNHRTSLSIFYSIVLVLSVDTFVCAASSPELPWYGSSTASLHPNLWLWGFVVLSLIILLPLVFSKNRQSSFRKLTTRWNTIIFVGMVLILLAMNVISHVGTYQKDARQIEQKIYEDAKTQVRDRTQLVVELIEQDHLLAHQRLRQQLKDDLTRTSEVVEQIIHQHGARLGREKVVDEVIERLTLLHSLYGQYNLTIIQPDGTILFSSEYSDRHGHNVEQYTQMGGSQLISRIKSLSQLDKPIIAHLYPLRSSNQHSSSEKILYFRFFTALDAAIVINVDHLSFEAQIKTQIANRLEHLHTPRSLTVFGGTFDGVSLFGPARGRNMWHIKDANGVHVVQELITSAQRGGGYVEYQMPQNLLNAGSYPKLSYSQKINSWDWYVGAGIDLNLLMNETDLQRAALIETIKWNIIRTTLAAALLILVLQLFTRKVSKRIDGSIVSLNSALDRAASQDSMIDIETIDFEEFTYIATAANHMLSERQQMMKTVLDREEDLSVTLDSIADAVIVTDERGSIKRMNSIAEQLTGWSSSEAESQSLSKVFNTQLDDELESSSLFDRVLKHGEAVENNEGRVLVSRQGVEYQIAESAAPICDAHGDMQGVIIVFRDVTQNYRQQQAMRENEQRMRLAINGAHISLWTFDQTTQMISIDTACHELLNFSCPVNQPLSLDQLFAEYCHPDDQHSVTQEFARYLQYAVNDLRCEFRLKTVDNHWRWVLATSEALSQQQDRGASHVTGMFLDIHDLKTSEAALLESEKRFRTMVNNAPLMVALFAPDMTPVFINEKWSTATGYPTSALYNSFESVIHPDDYQNLQSALELIVEQGEESCRLDLRYVSQNHSLFDIDTSIAPIFDQDNQVQFFLLMSSDITARRLVEKRLQWLALYDDLTRLANRSHLYQYLNDLLSQGSDTTGNWLYMLDLDRFKNINDNYGHAIGDQLLIEIGRRLNRFVEKNGGFAARLSGDEFIYIAEPALHLNQQELASQLIELITQPVVCSSIQLSVRTSIGAVPITGSTSSEVLRMADMAMYEAKRNKSVCSFQVYDDAMDDELREQLRLEEDMKVGLEHPEQFILHYQPIWNLTSGCLSGFEALIRWEHPELGRIAPDKFIPLAEETAMVVPLGRLILDRACQNITQWLAAFPFLSQQPFRVSVNVAPQEMMTNDFIDNACAIIARHQVSPQNLCFEITETTVMEDPQLAIERIRQLRDLGFHLSMDDFGTGYSSLSYLNQFQVNTIKLDRSLIHDIDLGGTSKKVSDAVIKLSHELDFNVVAEGVETLEQLEVLRSLKCDYIQGYLTGRPVSSDEIEPILQQPNLADMF